MSSIQSVVEEKVKELVKKDGVLFQSYWYVKALDIETVLTDLLSKQRTEMVEKIRDIYNKNYSHFTREYTLTDHFRDDILKAIQSNK